MRHAADKIRLEPIEFRETILTHHDLLSHHVKGSSQFADLPAGIDRGVRRQITATQDLGCARQPFDWLNQYYVE